MKTIGMHEKLLVNGNFYIVLFLIFETFIEILSIDNNGNFEVAFNNIIMLMIFSQMHNRSL